jgi:hypothetical protein
MRSARLPNAPRSGANRTHVVRTRPSSEGQIPCSAGKSHTLKPRTFGLDQCWMAPACLSFAPRQAIGRLTAGSTEPHSRRSEILGTLGRSPTGAAWPLPCERSAGPTRTYSVPRVTAHPGRSTTPSNRGRVVLRAASQGIVSGRLLAHRTDMTASITRGRSKGGRVRSDEASLACASVIHWSDPRLSGGY